MKLRTLLIFSFGLFCFSSTVVYSKQVSDVPKKEYRFIGKHFIASYYGCDYEALTNFKELKEAVIKASAASGAKVLSYVDHIFLPDGYSIAVLLSESHSSIHTYPDKQACFVDLFTCGTDCSAENFDKVLKEYLKPQSSTCDLIVRK